MTLRWNCLEPLTAIGIGIGACAIAPFDGGLAAGAVIGGAGLLSRIKENSRKAGLDDEKLIDRMQKALLRQLDHWDSVEERDAATRADAAMSRLLPQVMLTREQLAAKVSLLPQVDEAYPIMAARLVVDDLAKHDAMFAEPAAGAGASHERLFALQAVEAALRAAKDDPDYATLLTLDIAIELGRALAETLASINELAQKVEAGFAAVQAELARQRSNDAGANVELARLSEQALRGAVARFIHFSPHAETSKIVEAVEQFANDYEKLRQRLEALDAHDNRVRGLQLAAQQALDDGDLDQARVHLREAAQARGDTAEQAVRDASNSLASLAEADLLALQWQSAAENWQKASTRLHPFDARAAADLNISAGVKLYEFGRRYATGAMVCAIKAFESACDFCVIEKWPVKLAQAQVNLGNALQMLGEYSDGAKAIALFDSAVTAFQSAQSIFAQEGMTAEWAAAQNNLGNSFSKQGSRIGGPEGLALFAKAVSSFQAALKVRNRHRMPTEWAETQDNLGLALINQSVHTGGAERQVLLVRAIAAHEAALEVYTPKYMPDHWAATQSNLGNALREQGERTEGEEGNALLARSVNAYVAALEVLTRDNQPIWWAGIQNNLGNALSIQGERLGCSGGLEVLDRAVKAYEAALEVRTRQEMPAEWALSQANLAMAHESRGDLSEGLEKIKCYIDAEEAYTFSLEVFDPVHMPFHYQQASDALTRIRTKLTHVK